MTHSTSPSFSDLSLNSSILKAVAELGYQTPSEIQAKCIPLLLEGKDVLGLAQTGTGKTAAFALPLLNNLDPSIKKPQILVLTPTRELALQVAEAFEQYAAHIKGAKVLAMYGGQSYHNQISAIKNGAQIIVATPGRLIDHLERKTLKLNELKALVLDEADEMLRMGFIDDVETIMARTPKKKQTCLFSATMPKQIQTICKNYLSNAEQIRVAPQNSTVSTITQEYWQVRGMQKPQAIIRFMQAEQFDAAIIFVRTKNDTLTVAQSLEQEGFRVAPLNGDMTQQAREQAVERIKSGVIDIVVATDVAARGLDVERISLVINYDIPNDPEPYVHRIGRTGRAGRTGKAILFVKGNEKNLLRQIMRHTKSDMTQIDLPCADVIAKKRLQTLTEKVAKVPNNKDFAYFKETAKTMQSALDLSDEDLLASLLYLAQEKSPLKVKDLPRITRDKQSDKRTDNKRERQSERRNEPRDRRDKRVKDNDNKRHESTHQRSERFEKSEHKKQDKKRPNIPMDTYRIEVGRDDGVQVKNIVGAIANEANIASKFIGDIKLNNDHSTVELPKNMPDETLSHLQKVYVCNKALKMKMA